MTLDVGEVDPLAVGLSRAEDAWAKINLTLHVTGQRPDGYHLLDSLVVRAKVGDRLQVTPAEDLTLSVDGPFAEGVPLDARNLVIRAAELLDAGTGRGAALRLTKNLPAAAGIGGGSADAAATLRALGAHWGLPLPQDTATLGADVPVCLQDGPQRMTGVGEMLTPVGRLPPCWIVLVNPGRPLATPQVFAELQCKLNAPMDAIPDFANFASFATWLASQRNDLEAPARAILPEINICLEALKDAALTRMSGSGATCFGLYESAAQARAAADCIAKVQPGWWVAAAPMISSDG